MNNLVVFNSACGIFLGFAFLFQIGLWILCNEDVTALLESMKKCEASKQLASNAQKFAVFLAIREAKIWDSLMKQLGRRLTFISLLPAAISVLWNLNSGVDLPKYLQEPQSMLYASAAAQFIEVVLLFYIYHNLNRFQKIYCADLGKERT
jgi:hypothetical protein